MDVVISGDEIKMNVGIICFKIKNPPPVELCWQKKRNPYKKFNFLGWLNLPSKFDIELFIYEKQKNYYIQKGFSYHIILFE
jgi:hypothetical protein